MKKKRHTSTKDKNALMKGSCAGFLFSFAAALLTAPVEGKKARRKVWSTATRIKTFPSRTKERFLQGKDKLHQSGQIRYELIYGELDGLKEIARTSAAKDQAREE